jgi:hypothetical protein
LRNYRVSILLEMRIDDLAQSEDCPPDLGQPKVSRTVQLWTGPVRNRISASGSDQAQEIGLESSFSPPGQTGKLNSLKERDLWIAVRSFCGHLHKRRLSRRRTVGGSRYETGILSNLPCLDRSPGREVTQNQTSQARREGSLPDCPLTRN